jgi:hypothetical protein
MIKRVYQFAQKSKPFFDPLRGSAREGNRWSALVAILHRVKPGEHPKMPLQGRIGKFKVANRPTSYAALNRMLEEPPPGLTVLRLVR